MVKRNIDQKLRLRNFDARNERIQTESVVTSRRSLSGIERGQGVLLSVESKKDSVREETNADSKTRVTIVQNRHHKPLHPLSHQHQEVEVRRGKEPQRLESICEVHSTAVQRLPERYLHQITLLLLASSPKVKYLNLNRLVNSVISARLHTGRLKGNPEKKDGDESAVAIVESVRQLGCVLQDTEPSESLSILRKGANVLGPIRRIRFTKATQRQDNIGENKGPSLNEIQVKLPHQRSPNAVKFEDRSQEETGRQERCARGDTWRLVKNIFKLKETDKATFFLPTNEWSLPAPSTIKPEEGEFVVDSGAGKT